MGKTVIFIALNLTNGIFVNIENLLYEVINIAANGEIFDNKESPW